MVNGIKNISLLILLFFSTSLLANSENIGGKEFYRYKIIEKDSTGTDSLYSVASDHSKKDLILERKGVVYRGIKLNAESGASMISGLNLEIEGMITENIELKASVSDDKLALDEEGTDESLSSIDNIFIQFRHPNFMTRMGDYSIKRENGEFGNINKDLAGVLLNTGFKNNDLTSFVSSESSVRGSKNITGIEGVQGPYYIIDDTGKTLVQGSVEVYLNGAALKEGGDFYIDHFENRLFFKNTVNIREGDRITVDYEFKDSEYGRVAYGGYSKSWNNNSDIKILYLSEYDDVTDPSWVDMDGVEQEMSLSGNVDEIVVSGAEKVKEGEGNYVLASDSVHYIYAGPSEGDFRVRFSEFRDSGEYFRDIDSLGNVYYVYDAVNGGDYLPLITLKTPSKNEMFQASGIYKNSGLEVSGEIAVTSNDVNTLNSKGTGVFKGIGDKVYLKYNTKDSKAGKFGFELSRKFIGEELSLPSRYRSVPTEYDTESLLPDSLDLTEEHKSSFSHSFGKHLFNQISGMYSKGTQKSSITSGSFVSSVNTEKYGYKGIMKKERYVNPVVEINKDLYRIENSFRHKGYGSVPFFELLRTSHQDSVFAETEKRTLGISSEYSRKDLQIDHDLSFENEIGDISGINEYVSDRIISILELEKRFGTVFNSEFIWNYAGREKTGSVSEKIRSRSNQITGRMNYNNRDRYRIYAEYTTENIIDVKKTRTYYKVEDGTGDYIYSSGNYYPDEFGDYDYYITELGQGSGIMGVNLDIRSFFDLRSKNTNDNILYWISNTDIEQNILISERSRTDAPGEIYMLRLNRFQSDSTVSGNIESITGLYFFSGSRISGDYIFRFKKNMDRQFLNYSENERSLSSDMKLRGKTKDLFWELKGSVSSRKRYSSPGRILTDDIKKISVSCLFRFDPLFRLNYSIEPKYEDIAEGVKGFKVMNHSVRNFLNYSFSGSGIVRTELEVIKTSGSDNIPFYINSGLINGWSYKWNLGVDYRITDEINFTLFYNGRYLSYDRRPFNELRMEFRMEL